MQKQNKIVEISAIQGKLPRLAFVNILGVAAVQNRTVERLPQYVIQLAEKKTAQKVDVFVRFEENELIDNNNHDQGLVREQLKNWLSALLEHLDDHYALAFDGMPFAPRGGYRWHPAGNPNGFGPGAGQPWGAQAPQGQPEAMGPEPTREELAMDHAVSSLLNRLTDRYHYDYRPAGMRRTAFQSYLNYDDQGNKRLNFNANLGNGLTAAAYQIIEREEFDNLVEKCKAGEYAGGETIATFKHQNCEYQLTFSHNLLGVRLSTFVTEDALKAAWNEIWTDYWQSLTGASVTADKELVFLECNVK